MGVNRIHIPQRDSAIGTIVFDYRSVMDACDGDGIDLVLGYNTAIFTLIQRLRGHLVVMNMDGIEWKRSKWSLPAKAWFFVNEIFGSNVSHLTIADHPDIQAHVARRSYKTPVMIPYGAERIEDVAWRDHPHVEPGRYFISIARLEPENSILEIVRGFVRADLGDHDLLVVGRLDECNSYHQALRAAANDRVHFAGAIYDAETVAALRRHCLAHVHGHQVGGTNPSLVEALGAGSAVLAHDNRFNRWTTAEAQFYFANEHDCATQMRRMVEDDAAVAAARTAAVARFVERFQWATILGAYEVLLDRAHAASHEKRRIRFGARFGKAAAR